MGQSFRAQILPDTHAEDRQPYPAIRPALEQRPSRSDGRGRGNFRETPAIPGTWTAERAGIPKRGSAGTVRQTDGGGAGRPRGEKGLLPVPKTGPHKSGLRRSPADQPDPPECQGRTVRTYGKTRDVRKREEDPL